MKIRIGLVFALAALSAITLTAQTKAASPNSAIVGVWRASAEGQPFLTLTVTDESGELTGAILFYLHRREPGKPTASTPGDPQPIFHPVFDGQTLTFQVSHRLAHPPRTLSDPPVTFRFKLDRPNRILLGNEREGAPPIELIRSDQ